MENKELELEEEIDLLELWQVIVKRKWIIIGLTIIIPFLTAIYSLFMPNIYKSTAIIMPIEEKTKGLPFITTQFSGITSFTGISPTSSISAEIISLLKSNILREQVIKKYNLLPILFYEKWDEEKRQWKKDGFSFGKIIGKALAMVKPKGKFNKEDEDIPTIDDGIRALEDIVKINKDKKLGTISLSAEFPDPEMAKNIVDYFLNTLREHMTKEAIRIAEANKKSLEKELIKTSDPIIQQKIYSLIASQVETITMAKVNENFAFKIIDPPRIPDKKYKPKRLFMVMASFFIALFFSIFLTFFLEYLHKIKEKK
ncbi:MAG TPA: hypothetical protein ENG63_02625 [Candidatus Desulfofervidus auxilii]|uniref:Polysaccharide chain length determinant N-terminal domain-containing protein n=1 Tax=Desulfofervidus auxilii TaxID=1621989 RepID=A0A7C0Y3Y0_DESA2|nr:hypothetical protein [Candidatus Desulfofervidus auxilii]